MTPSPFLEADGVSTEEEAMAKSFQGALQHNRTYREGVEESRRKLFRTEWAEQIRKESCSYHQPAQSISDIQHCEAIHRISAFMTVNFENILAGGRLRYGTSQKAFNLYLKYLWRLGKVVAPPHCPVDSIVLSAAKVKGVWTKCDSQPQYVEWIGSLRMTAASVPLAEWEYRIWLEAALRKRAYREAEYGRGPSTTHSSSRANLCTRK